MNLRKNREMVTVPSDSRRGIRLALAFIVFTVICKRVFRSNPWPHILIAQALLLVMSFPEKAQALGTITNLDQKDGVITVEFVENPGVYYLLEYSTNLTTWYPADMSLGIKSKLDLQEGSFKGFFRAAPYSRYSPIDTDGDGMDDMYELNHEGLNPLDPSDGSKLAPNGNGKTNYQIYLSLFGLTSFKLLQREALEVSIFNFGLGDASEAISSEQSIFNIGGSSFSKQADSPEVSIFNGQIPLPEGPLQIDTREWSIHNYGGTPDNVAIFSRELSVFSGMSAPASDVLQIDGREWSLFNFGSPSAETETISLETSILNFQEP